VDQDQHAQRRRRAVPEQTLREQLQRLGPSARPVDRSESRPGAAGERELRPEDVARSLRRRRTRRSAADGARSALRSTSRSRARPRPRTPASARCSPTR
jgi:hypothetical protein